jgi:hypothetical protein
MAKAATLKARTSDVRKSKARKSKGKPAEKIAPMCLYSWLDGYYAGLSNKTPAPPKHLPKFARFLKMRTDALAWHSGYAEGAAQNRAGDVVHAVQRQPGGMQATNMSDERVLRAIGTVATAGAFEAGIRYALLQAQKGRPLMEIH